MIWKQEEQLITHIEFRRISWSTC